MYVVVIWDTPSKVRIFVDKDGFIRIFNTQEEALEYVKKFNGSLYYQIVELKRG